MMEPKNGERRQKNTALAIILIAALGVMLIPLPAGMLDLLLSINITLSLLIVLTVLNTARPMDFSTFPSILLFTAIFRLSLNVASTRLILLDGDAGHIIGAFGRFVIGDNYVVGIIIFLILVVIQFIVITKGQNRISEVAARFTLDAMPGKQMAIDADLNAGIITNDEARQRRLELNREAQFYGSMDGAGKFVRGDAIAGIIITAINIVGGLVLGVFDRGMPVDEAFQAYTRLTVGDGLVSQIPSLLVSTAAGILTAKSASEAGLGNEMSDQLLARPLVLRTTGLILAAVGFLPGMPLIPFLLVAGGLLWLGNRAAAQQSSAAKAAERGAEREQTIETAVEDLLTVDRLGIEIGYRLIPLVEPGRHGGLLDHIRAVRNQFASTLGIVVPPIRVRDNVQIDPNAYRVLLNGQVIAKGELRAGHFLAMDPGGADAGEIRGIDTIEPAFGLPAKWIAESDKDRAEMLGYTVIDAPSVLVTHLTEVLRAVANEILSRDDVRALVDNLKKTAPAVVDELIPNVLTLGQLQSVLGRLLKERIPIRNLQVILESLADSAHETKDPALLTEKARTALARAIVEPHLDGSGTLHAAVIDPNLERTLSEAIGGGEGLSRLPQGFLSKFVDSTAEALAAMARAGRDPVLVTRSALRPFLAEAVASVIPNAAVLSYQESGSAKKVETTSRISVPA
jgi:flagellar biosynthesis protein FlhA